MHILYYEKENNARRIYILFINHYMGCSRCLLIFMVVFLGEPMSYKGG